MENSYYNFYKLKFNFSMLPSDVIFYATKNDLKCTFVHYKNSIAIGYGEKYFSSFLCLTKDKEKELGHNVNYLNCKNKL